MPALRSIALVSLLLLLLATPCGAQVCPGAWLSPTGTSGVAYALTTLPEGDIIVGGSFAGVCSVPARNIARYSPSTNTWSALGDGLSSTSNVPSVRAITVLSSGDVVVGGLFTSAGGQPAANIARFSPAAGTWSPLSTGIAGTVRAMAQLPTGDLIVGGRFTNAGSVAADSIARWNPVTGTWSAVAAATFAGGNRFVNAIAPLENGDFAIAGDFTSISGTPTPFVARYTASTNQWSAIGAGFNAWANTLIALPGGELYAGGVFTTSGSTTVNRIARWSPSTNTWAPLGVGVSTLANSILPVNSLARTASGDIIVGGEFFSAGGVFRLGIARWSPSSSTWSSLDLGLDNDGASHPTARAAYALAVAGDDVFAAGSFQVAGLVPANNIARWSAAPASWSALGATVNDDIESLASHPSGDIIAGGRFTTVNGIAADHIARLTPSSNRWLALGDGVNDVVRAVACEPSGDVLAGGDFTACGPTTLAHIGRWSSSTNSWLPLGGGVNGRVLAIALAAGGGGGDVLIGGDFTSAGAAGQVPAAHVALWSSGQSAWLPLGSGVDGTVRAVLSLPGGDAVVGGLFATAGGTPCSNIARWDAAAAAWVAMGPGLNGRVNALLRLPGDDLVAAGEFTLAGTVSVRRLARWSFSTSTWTAIDGGTNGPIHALALGPSGVFVIGGEFDAIGTSDRIVHRVARFDPAIPSLTSVNEGIDGSVRAIASSPDGELFFGGTISSARPISGPPLPTPGLARWTNSPIESSQPLINAVAAYNVNLDLRVSTVSGYSGVTWQWLHNGVPIVNGPEGASVGGGTAGPPPVGSGNFGGASGIFPHLYPERGAYLYIYGARQSDAGLYSALLTSACGSTIVQTYNITVRCPGDYNADGVFTVADIFAFISAWFDRRPQSFYHHGAAGQLEDIFDFLNAWFTGC